MSSVTTPRGPLPARVYWVRRGVLVLVVLALVFITAQVLSAFGGGNQGPTRAAAPMAQKSTSPAATGAASPRAAAGPVGDPGADPTGPCLPGEVRVVPVGKNVHGGSATQMPLKLLGTTAACTFEVSPRSLVAKITSGTDRIWSTQDCPDAVTSQSVVVRSSKPTQISVQWSGRRSEADCAPGLWSKEGYYHLSAAALGGEPENVQFKVLGPLEKTVYKTKIARPTPSGSASPH